MHARSRATSTERASSSLDFALDIDALHCPESLALAGSDLVLASAGARLPGPVDGITTALDNPGLLAADARRSRSLGFAGKLCIHPKQLQTVRDAFKPTKQEVDWARRVVAVAEGSGAMAVEDEMVDKPVVARARRILAAAVYDG